MSDHVEEIPYYIIDIENNYKKVFYEVCHRTGVNPKTFEEIHIITLNCNLARKHGKWLRMDNDNYIFDNIGIFKNRIDIQTEYFCRLNLQDQSDQYLINRIYSAIEKLDKLNIPFNLIQKEVVDETSFWTVLETYVIFKNKNDLAKYKMLG